MYVCTQAQTQAQHTQKHITMHHTHQAHTSHLTRTLFAAASNNNTKTQNIQTQPSQVRHRGPKATKHNSDLPVHRRDVSKVTDN